MYNVFLHKNGYGDPMFFSVSNEPSDWNSKERRWPQVVQFHIAIGFSIEDQRRRANEYADYMNKTLPQQPPIGA